MKAEETVVMFIEFQNDFCKEGGKLHDLVREEMARNHTIENALRLLKGARDKGAYILHVPFELDTGRFEENPQDGLLAKLYEMPPYFMYSSILDFGHMSRFASTFPLIPLKIL